MARKRNIDKLPIKIDESVMTYGSGFDIAQNLRICSNVVKKFVMGNGSVRMPFGAPALPRENGVVLDPPVSIANGSGIWASNALRTRMLIGAQDKTVFQHNKVYDLETGLPLPIDPAVDLGNVLIGPWSFAYAPNIDQPTTFVTADNGVQKAKIIETFTGSGVLKVAEYTPNFDPDGLLNFKPRPSLFYYHLNRLWLSYVSALDRRSIIFFTDAINVDTIRANNFLDFPDINTAIFRASASDLDTGSQAHLLFAGPSSIFILDGDPTLGNATFRQLKKSFGIFSQQQVVETTEGACFLASDGLIYLVPRGALEPIPISGGIRNQFNPNDSTLSLAFRHPYLFVILSGNKIWLGDMTGITQGNIYWTGPHAPTEALVLSSPVSDHPFQQGKIKMVSQRVDTYSVVEIDDNFRSIAPQRMQSGYFSAPDSHVRFKRSFLSFQQASRDMSFVMTVTDSLGRSDFLVFTVPATTVPTTDKVEHVLIVLPVALGGEHFFVDIQSMSVLDQLENIRDWMVEYRIDPRKH